MSGTTATEKHPRRPNRRMEFESIRGETHRNAYGTQKKLESDVSKSRAGVVRPQAPSLSPLPQPQHLLPPTRDTAAGWGVCVCVSTEGTESIIAELSELNCRLRSWGGSPWGRTTPGLRRPSPSGAARVQVGTAETREAGSYSHREKPGTSRQKRNQLKKKRPGGEDACHLEPGVNDA